MVSSWCAWWHQVSVIVYIGLTYLVHKGIKELYGVCFPVDLKCRIVACLQNRADAAPDYATRLMRQIVEVVLFEVVFRVLTKNSAESPDDCLAGGSLQPEVGGCLRCSKPVLEDQTSKVHPLFIIHLVIWSRKVIIHPLY